MVSVSYLIQMGTNTVYCEIIYFRGAQFSWIHEIEYIRGDVISRT